MVFHCIVVDSPGAILRENCLSSQKLIIANITSNHISKGLGWVVYPTALHAGIWCGLSLRRSAYSVSATVCSQVQLSCCVQKTRSPGGHPLPLALTLFLFCNDPWTTKRNGTAYTVLLGLSILWSLLSAPWPLGGRCANHHLLEREASQVRDERTFI